LFEKFLRFVFGSLLGVVSNVHELSETNKVESDLVTVNSNPTSAARADRTLVAICSCKLTSIFHRFKNLSGFIKISVISLVKTGKRILIIIFSKKLWWFYFSF